MVSQASPGSWALDLKQPGGAPLRRRPNCAILVRVLALCDWDVQPALDWSAAGRQAILARTIHAAFAT
jgi:hypothetical protein